MGRAAPVPYHRAMPIPGVELHEPLNRPDRALDRREHGALPLIARFDACFGRVRLAEMLAGEPTCPRSATEDER